MSDTKIPRNCSAATASFDLMPLAWQVVSLPPSELGRYFSEEQIETRVFVMRHAFKAARQLPRNTAK